MTNDLVGVLTEEEIAAFGIKEEDFELDTSRDNPVVTALIKGEASTDARGRPIISYRQYLELSQSGVRLDNYMLRLKGPTGVGLGQATKLQKYIGEGSLPIELWEAQQKKVERKDEIQASRDDRDAPTVVDKNSILIYPCSTKYPQCNRFFDTPRARQTHWGLTHEKKFKSKKEMENA